jgi:hypothetical protein
MELDGESKQAVQELGDAINEAIERSERVIEALEKIRRAGFEPNIGIKLNIGLMPLTDPDEIENAPQTELETELTDEDLRELRKMKIILD